MFLCLISTLDGGDLECLKKRNKIFILFHKPSFSILFPFYTVKCHIYFFVHPTTSSPSSNFFRFLSFILSSTLSCFPRLDSTLLCSYICSTLALAISVKMFHRFEPFFCFSFFFLIFQHFFLLSFFFLAFSFVSF